MFLWQRRFIKFGCLLGISFFANSVSAQTPIFVDKELMLEIDVSDSINDQEYNDIITGYSNAFRDTEIQSRIDKLSDGVAVGVQFFSSGQAKMVSNAVEYLNDPTYDETSGGNSPLSNYFDTNAQWFILDQANDAQEFANFLDNFLGNRPEAGGSGFSANSGGCSTQGFLADGGGDGVGTGTNIAGAIQQGTCEINRVAQRYSRPSVPGFVAGPATTAKIVASYEQAIDISSDGIQNTYIDGTEINIAGNSANAVCNNTIAHQADCIAALAAAQGQSAHLGTNSLAPGYVAPTGIDNSGDFQWDSPITRINGLPVNNDVAYETEYFETGYDQTAIGGGSSIIGPVVGGVNQGATNDISDNTFDSGVGVNGSFVVSADDYGAFEPAIILKIQNELEAVPFEFKPGFGLLLGVGIFGLRHWHSKKSNQKLKTETKTKNNQEIPEQIPVLTL